MIAAHAAGHGPRAGTILIVVAGISALLMSVTVAYLINMRSDMEESDLVVREAQARIVLIAALQYVQESSRMGWDRKGTLEHEEAFGWADVRDGSAGPKDRYGVALYDATRDEFPKIGGKAARFMLHALERPPYAITSAFAPNAAPMDPSKPWSELVSYQKNDPEPAVTTWEEFEEGRKTPRQESYGRSWFRVYRDRDPPMPSPTNPPVEPATFTITCGAGGTLGFRSFKEADDAGEGALFNDDADYFAILRSQERILWFRTEWTSAVGGSGMGVRIKNGFWELPEINDGSYPDFYKGGAINVTDTHWWVNRNPVGSFLYIQRLEHEPTDW